MLIRDFLVMLAAAHVAKEDNGILSATHDGVQLFKGWRVRMISECYRTRMYGKNSGKIPVLYTVVSEVPVFALLLRPVKDNTPPPEECYKLHLCTEDPTGELI